MLIRAAVEGDAHAMGRVHVRAWQGAYRGVMPDEYLDALDAEERSAMWRVRIARTDLPPLLVAVIADEVVGFAVYGDEQPSTESPSCGQLYAINLDPAHWGRGIGRTLLRASTAALVAKGYEEAVLWVVPQNARAKSLYESEGWSADGGVRTEQLLGVTVTDIRYRKRLSG